MGSKTRRKWKKPEDYTIQMDQKMAEKSGKGRMKKAQPINQL